MTRIVGGGCRVRWIWNIFISSKAKKQTSGRDSDLEGIVDSREIGKMDEGGGGDLVGRGGRIEGMGMGMLL